MCGQVAIVIDISQLADFVQWNADRRARRAAHFRKGLWAIFAMIGSGFVSFPKFAISRRIRASLRSLKLKS